MVNEHWRVIWLRPPGNIRSKPAEKVSRSVDIISVRKGSGSIQFRLSLQLPHGDLCLAICYHMLSQVVECYIVRLWWICGLCRRFPSTTGDDNGICVSSSLSKFFHILTNGYCLFWASSIPPNRKMIRLLINSSVSFNAESWNCSPFSCELLVNILCAHWPFSHSCFYLDT